MTAMGPTAGLAVLLLIGGAALVRAWSMRRLRGGDRRTIPVLLLSTLVVALLLVGAAAWFAFRSPLLGIPLTIGALVVGGAWLRVSIDAARFTGPASRPRDGMDDLAERMDRAYRGLATGLLGVGFVGALLAVLWLFARGRF
jgi:hypothetical protein